MGVRRSDHRRRFTPLVVEPLEERFLLSIAGISESGVVTKPDSHYSIVSHASSQSQPSIQNDSTVQPTTSDPSAPLPAGKTLPDDTGCVSQDETGGPYGVGRETTGSIESRMMPAPTPAASIKSSGTLLYPIVSPHPMMSPDAQGLDGDDSYTKMEMEDDHLFSQQALSQQYLFTSVALAELHDGAPAASTQTSLPLGGLQPPRDVLSTAGLGTVQVVWVPTALPASTAFPRSGEAQRYPEPDQGLNMAPPIPEYQPLVVPPPSEEVDSPPPLSSAGEPFADLLPIDVEAIQRSADAFFQQLARFSEEWNDGRVIHKLTPWLLVAGVTAYEWVRLRRIRKLSIAGLEENDSPESMLFLAGENE